ncbi:glucose-6-phosphate dehydrogenase [Nocardia sp. NPDC057668]|uniref:glucose-6-phosphate dehydrogenase n=1 Tax=Nocardia sp. NPDC057668 TaxID=3346202 RepID=UPI00366AB6DF
MGDPIPTACNIQRPSHTPAWGELGLPDNTPSPEPASPGELSARKITDRPGAAAHDALVIFGVTGDLLAARTFRALYKLEGAGRLVCPVIGIAPEDWSHYRLIAAVRSALTAAGDNVEPEVLDRLARRMTYLRGDFTNPATYRELATLLGNACAPLFYLATAPTLFATVIARLRQAELIRGASVLIEKSFGRDATAARSIDAELRRELGPDQLLRVDRFLNGQSVLDLACLRFDHAMFGPVWNSDHIAAVQITMAENSRVESGDAHYDSVGALRDMVQTRLLQVLAFLAMEEPADRGPHELWSAMAEAARATADVDSAHMVAGQYLGYRKVLGVRENSTTETFAALRLQVDTPRWSGVPWLVRAGKALFAHTTEVRVIFRRPPPLAFLRPIPHVEANQLIMRLDPDPGLRLQLASRRATDATARPVHVDLPFAAEPGEPADPDERMLRDALSGKTWLFPRAELVEESWRILQPVFDSPPAPTLYPKGSWGPPGTARLAHGHHSWQRPWLPSPSYSGRAFPTPT